MGRAGAGGGHVGGFSGGRSMGGHSGGGRSHMSSGGRSGFSSSSIGRSSSHSSFSGSSFGGSSLGGSLFGSSSSSSSRKHTASQSSKPARHVEPTTSMFTPPPPIHHAAPPPPPPRPRTVVVPQPVVIHEKPVYNTHDYSERHNRSEREYGAHYIEDDGSYTARMAEVDDVRKSCNKQLKEAQRQLDKFKYITFVLSVFVVICFVSMIVYASKSTTGTHSTVQRERVETGVVFSGRNFVDMANWVEDADGLSKSLEYFYQKTGVAPYLIIQTFNDVTEESLAAKAEEEYNAHFDDEGHLLLIFNEDDTGSWMYQTWMGAQCSTVMDNEACNILFDYIDAYYYSDRDTTHFFGDAFRDAADKIMTKEKGFFEALAVPIILVILCIILLLIFRFVIRSKELKVQQARADAEILNADFGKIADNELEELKNKYK